MLQDLASRASTIPPLTSDFLTCQSEFNINIGSQQWHVLTIQLPHKQETLEIYIFLSVLHYSLWIRFNKKLIGTLFIWKLSSTILGQEMLFTLYSIWDIYVHLKGVSIFVYLYWCQAELMKIISSYITIILLSTLQKFSYEEKRAFSRNVVQGKMIFIYYQGHQRRSGGNNFWQ